MSASTMVDLGGLAFLKGDPLGLRELDESLAWKTNGPLPDWLDGADLEDDHSPELPLPPSSDGRPPTPAPLDVDTRPTIILPPVDSVVVIKPDESPPSEVVASQCYSEVSAASLIESSQPEPLSAELVDSGPPPPVLEVANEELVSIDVLSQFVDELPPLTAAPLEVAAPPETQVEAIAPLAARRFLSVDELIDARLCLVAVVADRLWAIPLERVAQVTSRPAGDRAIDLFERQEGKKRRGPGVTIEFDFDVAVTVDRILGSRSLAWRPLAAASDAPAWMLAQTTLAGEDVGLLDWEFLIVG